MTDPTDDELRHYRNEAESSRDEPFAGAATRPGRQRAKILSVRMTPEEFSGDQLVQQTGEQLVEDLRAARLQQVTVTAVRHPLPHALPGRGADQGVAFDDGDPVVELGQHARRQQPGHARAEHHRMLAAHDVPPGLVKLYVDQGAPCEQ